MNGHSSDTFEGEIVIWADASLERFQAGYEEFTLYIQEDNGSTKLIRCFGYIGFQMVGFWDEVIIETAAIHSSHPFIIDCERKVSTLPDSGSNLRTATGNRLLEITLIDGCSLLVCANHFRSEGVKDKEG